jgi:hypothetical protein
MKSPTHKISKHTPSLFQGRLSFPGPGVMSFEFPVEMYVRRTLFFALSLLLVGYLYAVCATVLNIVARKEAIALAEQKAQVVASLEKEYFASVKKLTIEDGASLSLKPVEATSFVRIPAHTALSARNEL